MNSTPSLSFNSRRTFKFRLDSTFKQCRQDINEDGDDDDVSNKFQENNLSDEDEISDELEDEICDELEDDIGDELQEDDINDEEDDGDEDEFEKFK
ncbi:rRNA biogenesis protein rrp36-like [Vicia villosa]|uniref:rRNA biogenesis protein rrp36-like n=1 Tax=Vicia villosa TaxID=3911 RepID=UPI00273B0D6A|nr:rRNA biogenesis protein rrp36-like [Vicia villosa]